VASACHFGCGRVDVHGCGWQPCSEVDCHDLSVSCCTLVEGEDGKTHQPSIQQFPQMTMQPHMDMVRSDAAMFAGETSIPVNALGVIHDQPASDAAMLTAYLDLNKLAERAHDSFGYGWSDAMQMAIQMRDGFLPDGA